MNLNKSFEKYARRHASVLRSGGEEALNILYSRWLTEPDAELGSSPKEYLEGQSVKGLIDMLDEEAKGGSIGEAVVAELEKRDSAKELRLFIKESESDDAVMTAAEILERQGSAPELDVYLDIVMDKSRSYDLREELVSLIKGYANAAAPYIYERLENADAELKTIFAEILICADRDDKTYNLLVELFAFGDNIPLYCSYFGAYGDERAAAILYRALDKADYADFTEISNAIERLGGTVDYDMRDFNSDPTYRKIKDGN